MRNHLRNKRTLGATRKGKVSRGKKNRETVLPVTNRLLGLNSSLLLNID
jgi:hypothetical protein